jgi:hypothetical protein
MAESGWTALEVTLEHLQNLVSQRYMIAAELASCHVPKDPACPASAGGDTSWRAQRYTSKNSVCPHTNFSADLMDGNSQTWFHNESRVGEARVYARWLAKANRLMCWIVLLFGKVESLSGTNKARSKILKIRTRI